MPAPIQKTLTLSVAHLPSWDEYEQALEDEEIYLPHDDFGSLHPEYYKYGILINIPVIFCQKDLDKLPTWLIPIVSLACKESCSWIHFSEGASELPDFKTYQEDTEEIEEDLLENAITQELIRVAPSPNDPSNDDLYNRTVISVLSIKDKLLSGM